MDRIAANIIILLLALACVVILIISAMQPPPDPPEWGCLMRWLAFWLGLAVFVIVVWGSCAWLLRTVLR